VTGGLLFGNGSTATPTAVGADGDATLLWLTQNGALNVADAGGSLTVDGTVTVTDGSGALNVIVDSGTLTTVSTVTSVTAIGTSVTPGTSAAHLGKAEDAAHASGDTLVALATKRTDAAAASAGTDADYQTLNTDASGLLWTRGLDPCSGVAKQYIPINISTATTTELTASLAGASTHYYVCSINIGPVAGAQNIALVDDDTDNCASVTSGLAGGTTAGSGWNIAANGGLTFGNGSSSIARTGGTNRVLCAVTSAAVQTSGVMTVVAAP
jgi:hypothetical protein